MIKGNKIKTDGNKELTVSNGKGSPFTRWMQNILGGTFLTRQAMVNLLPFLLFATFLTILYIANIYYAEKDVREFNALKSELKEFRYEYITSKSKLMSITKQSEITKRLHGSGVKESVVSPYKLIDAKPENNR